MTQQKIKVINFDFEELLYHHENDVFSFFAVFPKTMLQMALTEKALISKAFNGSMEK